MSKAKKQATLPDELKDTTALAEDLEAEETFEYVGYRYRYRWSLTEDKLLKTGFAEPVRLSELREDDNLVEFEHLKSLNRAFTPLARLNRKRKARRSKWWTTAITGLVTLLSAGGLTLASYSGFFNLSPGDNGFGWSVAVQFVLPIFPFISFLAFMMSIFQRSYRYADESDFDDLPFTKIGNLKKIDGTTYALENASYEGFLQATKLLSELEGSSKLLRESNEQIKVLKSENASPGALKIQEEIRDKIQERITVIESEIEELLCNENSMNQSDETVKDRKLA